MAVVMTPTKYAVSLKVNTGTTETGKMKTGSISLGTLNTTQDETTFNAKAYAIAEALAACILNTVVRVEYTRTATITDDE